MKLSKRILAAVLAAASVSVVLCSCQGDTTASQAASDSPSAGGETSDTASEGDSGDTGERVKLRMFFGDSGSAVPSGTDVSDEPFINIVEDYANVDLEVIQPAYADFQTQFNLMMTSGDLPDIIHCWFTDDCMKYGDQGAFIDLKEYYDNSPVVQNVISPEVMELSKSRPVTITAFRRAPTAPSRATATPSVMIFCRNTTAANSRRTYRATLISCTGSRKRIPIPSRSPAATPATRFFSTARSSSSGTARCRRATM